MPGRVEHMNAKQKNQARWLGRALVALGPISLLLLWSLQGAELDTVQYFLLASMMLPTLFGLAVLAMLKRIPEQDQDLIL